MLDLTEPSQQRLVRRPVLPVGGEQRLRLDRVAERGAGAVRLHRVDLGRREPGAGQRLPDDPLLGRAVRRGQPVGRAVLVDRAAAHHRQHRVPVAARVGQPLQQQQPDALGQAHAVRGGGERLAPAVRRQAPLPGEPDEHRRAWPSRSTPPASARCTPRRAAPAGQVQRHQRRRAGRVDRHRRALQPEDVDTRPETTLAACRSAGSPPVRRRGCSAGAVVLVHAAANTPVRLPRRRAGSMPARSNASQDASSSSRCCGSMASASRGLIPKNSASNSAASCEEPALAGVASVPGWSGSGSYSAVQVPAPVGGEGRSRRARGHQSHRSSGPATPPGIAAAIADDRDRVRRRPAASAGRRRVPTSPSSSPRRCSASTAGVGWSKTSVAGRRRPVAVRAGCAARPRSASRSPDP